MFQTLLLLAALQAAAPAPQAAQWTAETVRNQPVLRGATAQDPGDRIIFLCNEQHQIVAMLFRQHGAPQEAAAAVELGHWLIDGRAESSADPRPIIPIEPHIISLVRIEPALFRRLTQAYAVGFVWTGASGTALASYQLDMTGGRAALIAFARACNAEIYP